MSRLNYSALKKSIFDSNNEGTIKDVIQKGIDEEPPVAVHDVEKQIEPSESAETEQDETGINFVESEDQSVNESNEYDAQDEDESAEDEPESDVHYSNYGSSMIDNFQNKARAYKEGNNGNAVTITPNTDVSDSDDDVSSREDNEEHQSDELSRDVLFRDDESDDNQSKISDEQDSDDENLIDVPVKSKSQVKHRVYPKYVSDADIAKSALRDFPTDMATYIKDLFNGEAKTMSEAVAAYVYLKGDLPSDIAVPSRIKEVAAHYIGETVTNNDLRYELRNEIRSLKVLINDLKTANRDMMQKMCDVELATVYSVFEKLGFSSKQADAPEDLDFLEIGVTDMERRLESQSKNRREREKIAKGRPIK